MIPAALAGTGSVLAGRRVTNDEVSAALKRPRPAGTLEARTGIRTRYWMDRDQRLAPVGADALRLALDAAGLRATDLRRILFSSSTGGDWISPATAADVALALGLTDSCDAFDVNAACTGFLTALDLGARCVATGSGPVGLVVVEKSSDVLDPGDPRTFQIFGDAAAAAVLTPATQGEGLLGVSLTTDPSYGKTVSMAHPRWSGRHEPVRFGIPNQEMMDGAIALLRVSMDRALAMAGLALSDVDWVLPHQPNGVMFDAIVTSLGIDPDRTLDVVREIGSTAAAAIPVSLDRLLRTGRTRRGHTVLMVGIGGGVGYGALVWRL